MIKHYTDWDEFKEAKMCNSWVATAIIGGSLISGGAGIAGSLIGSSAQSKAAQNAIDTNMKMYLTTMENLNPFRQLGTRTADTLEARLPELTKPIDVTAELKNPDSIVAKAYDFAQTQGQKAVSNSAAARGLGVSGAALKGATAFNKGLIDQTYPTLYNMASSNQTNAFNKLKSVVDLGENAAAQTGTAGQVFGQTIGNLQMAQGNAQAAGVQGSTNAIANSANNIAGYYAYKGLYGDKGSGGNSAQVPIGTTEVT